LTDGQKISNFSWHKSPQIIHILFGISRLWLLSDTTEPYAEQNIKFLLRMQAFWLLLGSLFIVQKNFQDTMRNFEFSGQN